MVNIINRLTQNHKMEEDGSLDCVEPPLDSMEPCLDSMEPSLDSMEPSDYFTNPIVL